MAEYIKRKDLGILLPKLSLDEYRCEEFFDVLDDLPSIDIVKCKECKYWMARKSPFGVVVHFCGYEIRGTITASEDFCSHGERDETD